MTESDWLAANDPDAMLRLVGTRFSERRWHLLCLAVVTRLRDLFGEGPLAGILSQIESNAGNLRGTPEALDLMLGLDEAIRQASEESRERQRLIVLPADPDSKSDAYRHGDARTTHPTAPLFQAACRHAGTAVLLTGEAVARAAETIPALLTMRPGPGMLNRVRELVIVASRVRGRASLHAALALKLKSLGDDFADQHASRNARHVYATAIDLIRREEEFLQHRTVEQNANQDRADLRGLGRALHEVIGNPFRPYRFESIWRTPTVLGLARGIVTDGAYDRMPILADALLDADCDEEAILRHCRGTERHASGECSHSRGCWVLDLILEEEVDCFRVAPIPSGLRAPRPKRQLPIRQPVTVSE